jgi:hypothetical protein
MREALAKLLSSDDTQASMLHLVLIIEVLASILPMFIMCGLALRSTEPFSQTVIGMSSFIKDYGIGVAAIFGGTGSMWLMKGKGNGHTVA